MIIKFIIVMMMISWVNSRSLYFSYYNNTDTNNGYFFDKVDANSCTASVMKNRNHTLVISTPPTQASNPSGLTCFATESVKTGESVKTENEVMCGLVLQQNALWVIDVSEHAVAKNYNTSFLRGLTYYPSLAKFVGFVNDYATAKTQFFTVEPSTGEASPLGSAIAQKFSPYVVFGVPESNVFIMTDIVNGNQTVYVYDIPSTKLINSWTANLLPVAAAGPKILAMTSADDKVWSLYFQDPITGKSDDNPTVTFDSPFDKYFFGLYDMQYVYDNEMQCAYLLATHSDNGWYDVLFYALNLSGTGSADGILLGNIPAGFPQMSIV